MVSEYPTGHGLGQESIPGPFLREQSLCGRRTLSAPSGLRARSIQANGAIVTAKLTLLDCFLIHVAGREFKLSESPWQYVVWNLKASGFVERVRRGVYRATESGRTRAAVMSSLTGVDLRWVKRRATKRPLNHEEKREKKQRTSERKKIHKRRYRESEKGKRTIAAYDARPDVQARKQAYWLSYYAECVKDPDAKRKTKAQRKARKRARQRERYATDPVFREKRAQICRERYAAKKRAMETQQMIAKAA